MQVSKTGRYGFISIIQYLLSLVHNNNNYHSLLFLSRQHFITFAPSSPARPGISLGIPELSPQPMKILIDNGHGIQTKGKPQKE